jgi:hypothetical protein
LKRYLFVSLLSGSESRLVNAVVDGVVDPSVQLVDLRAESLRVEVQVLLFPVREERVEAGVEEPDDLRGLVGDDRLRLGVVDDGDGEPGVVVRVDLEVDVPHVSSSELELVAGSGLEVGVERPAFFEHVRVDDGVVLKTDPIEKSARSLSYVRADQGQGPTEKVLETLELPHDESSVSPWAGERDLDIQNEGDQLLVPSPPSSTQL